MANNQCSILNEPFRDTVLIGVIRGRASLNIPVSTRVHLWLY
jgi:hypothetical protein